MKNIEQLIELKKSHKIYFSCNGCSMLMKHLKDFLHDKETIAPPKTGNHNNILVLAFLTSIDDIKTEIIFSDKYSTIDHHREGAIGGLPCITAFIHCQDKKLESELIRLKSLLSC